MAECGSSRTGKANSKKLKVKSKRCHPDFQIPFQKVKRKSAKQPAHLKHALFKHENVNLNVKLQIDARTAQNFHFQK